MEALNLLIGRKVQNRYFSRANYEHKDVNILDHQGVITEVHKGCNITIEVQYYGKEFPSILTLNDIVLI